MEGDDETGVFLQQYPGVASWSCRPPARGMARTLSLPVHRRTAVPLDSQTLGIAPVVSRPVGAGSRPLDDDLTRPVAHGQPVKDGRDRRRPGPASASADKDAGFAELSGHLRHHRRRPVTSCVLPRAPETGVPRMVACAVGRDSVVVVSPDRPGSSPPPGPAPCGCRRERASCASRPASASSAVGRAGVPLRQARNLVRACDLLRSEHVPVGAGQEARPQSAWPSL